MTVSASRELRSLAAAPECQRAGVPMISPPDEPKVTAVGDYIFRVCFIDPFQGSTMAKFAAGRSRPRRRQSSATSRTTASTLDFFHEEFVRHGGVPTSYPRRHRLRQLTTIRGVQPDVVFVPGYYTEVGLIARQARELGITVPLLGGDGWDSPRTVEIGGAAVNGCYFSNHYAADDPNPVVQKFIEKFRAKYSDVPDAMAVLGYDAAQVLADAIRRAGTTEGKKLRDAIAATKDFPGVSGKITIDAERNARKSIVVLKIDGGKVQFFQKVRP